MTVIVSLRIENRYEDDEEPVITTVVDEEIPAPPAPDDATYDDWAYDNIYKFTGTGREEGDSWYDVEVTACSDPALVGRTFDWGY